MNMSNFWAILAGAAVVVFALGTTLSNLQARILRIERQNDRQLEMLIALLGRHNINPVTLDDDF